MPTLSESCYAPIGFLCAYPVAEKGCSSSKGGRIFAASTLICHFGLPDPKQFASQGGGRYNSRK